MIPEEKKAVVLSSVNEAFGTTVIEDVCTMSNGLGSDLVFRIVVRGTPFLLRIMTRSSEVMNPGRIYVCMSAAAAAGLTPMLRYSNAEHGISISDFVQAQPFSPRHALVEVPGMLGRLHALPPFPKAFNYVTAHTGFIWRFRSAGLVPEAEIEEVFSRYDQICAVYPRVDSDIVSCHMDLNRKTSYLMGSVCG